MLPHRLLSLFLRKHELKNISKQQGGLFKYKIHIMSKHLLKNILKCMIATVFIGQFSGIKAKN